MYMQKNPNTVTRRAILLTCNVDSKRAQFSRQVLERIGFIVEPFVAIPHEVPLKSHKQSMMQIYERIATELQEDWVYVFEDDINILADISLDEIVQYEAISSRFFYLGICELRPGRAGIRSSIQINNHPVVGVKGGIRGLHAIALNCAGAAELLEWCRQRPEELYIDVILEQFSIKYPSIVVRYDLESYIRGHRGVFFQDRRRFPTTLEPPGSQPF